MWRLNGYCLFVFTVMLTGLLLPGAGMAQHERSVVETLPIRVDVDLRQDILLFASGNRLYAYDLKTGEERWSKSRTEKDLYYFSIALGGTYAVMGAEQVFVVLDKKSGAEVWRQSAGRWQQTRRLWYDANPNWLWRNCRSGLYLYDLQARRGYKVPLDREHASLGLMSDEKRVYSIRNLVEQSRKPSRAEVSFWEIGTRAPSKGYVLTSPGELIFRGLSGDELLVSDYLYNRTPEHILNIHAVNHGEILHEFDPANSTSMSAWFGWMSWESSFYFWVHEDGNTLYRMNVSTRDIAVATVPEGHRAAHEATSMDADGHWWFATTDADRNFWIWPFNHTASPRKLLDGQRFLPNHWVNLGWPHLYAYSSASKNALCAYHIDTMQKLGEWAGSRPWLLTSKDGTTVAVPQHDEEGIETTAKTTVSRLGAESPLFTVKGSAQALSGDGRYLLVMENRYFSGKRGASWQDYQELTGSRAKNRPVHLIEVDSGQALARYENKAWATTAFSDDSSKFALFSDGALTIVNIEAGLAETHLFVPGRSELSLWGLSFSPDGTRLATSGYGEALLFDGVSGAHIATLTEKARFMRSWAATDPEDGFLSRAESRVVDFVGRYTDRLKSPPRVNATFTEDNTALITVTHEMLIRVWDAKTGRLKRTIDPKLPEQRNRQGRIYNGIRVSGNGAYALAFNRHGFDDGALWDITSGRKLRSYTFRGADAVDAVLSEDGTRVYALINGDLHYLDGAKKSP